MAATKLTFARLIAPLLGLFFMVTGMAPAQKIGYVSTEEILNRLPDAKTARRKLDEMQTLWMRDISRQESEITKLRNDIQTNRLLWSSQERQEAEARLKDMESKLAQFRAGKYGPNGEYERQHAELMGPVIQVVSAAIELEMKAQKYDYVFDKSNRSMGMLFANPDYDLTAAVLTRLGVKTDTADTAPSGSSTPSSDAVRNRGSRGRDGSSTTTTPPPEKFDPNTTIDPEETKNP